MRLTTAEGQQASVVQATNAQNGDTEIQAARTTRAWIGRALTRREEQFASRPCCDNVTARSCRRGTAVGRISASQPSMASMDGADSLAMARAPAAIAWLATLCRAVAGPVC